MEKKLGRIQKATFGFGGYQDAMIGFGVTLGGEGWGTSDFIGGWQSRSEYARFTVEEHHESWLKAMDRLKETLSQAQKSDVAQLVGVPVEVIFEDRTLKSWRVLTEVL